MERELLGAFLTDREAFRAVAELGEHGASFSDLGKVIYEAIAQYYERDGSAQDVSRAVLLTQLEGKINNEKVFERVRDAVNGLPESSVPNVVEAYRQQRQFSVGQQLSAALLKGDAKHVNKLLSEYTSLEDGIPKEDGSAPIEEYHLLPVEELFNRRGEQPFKLHPLSLHEKTDGGATHGDHIVISGRVENGKSLLAINLASSLCHDGHKVLYLGNEDSYKRMLQRFVSRFSGMTKDQCVQNPKEAMAKAIKNGYKNLVFLSAAGGTPADIEKLVVKHKPSVLVIDQIRNMDVGDKEKTSQLEKAALAVRQIVKRHGILGISVTQSMNDELHINKLVPDMSDVADSKVGLPGQADLLVLLGTNEDYRNRNMAMLVVAKNKLGGWHGHFPVQLNKPLSLVQDL